jgi:hypothetical protein
MTTSVTDKVTDKVITDVHRVSRRTVWQVRSPGSASSNPSFTWRASLSVTTVSPGLAEPSRCSLGGRRVSRRTIQGGVK